MSESTNNPLNDFLNQAEEEPENSLFAPISFPSQPEPAGAAVPVPPSVPAPQAPAAEMPEIPAIPPVQTPPQAQTPATTPAQQPTPDKTESPAAEQPEDPFAQALKKAQAKSEERLADSFAEKDAVFVYGKAKDPISDRECTFEDLRARYEADFPELSDAKKVSWTVLYGKTTKTILNPGSDKVYDIKAEIEKSKTFLENIRKAKTDSRAEIEAKEAEIRKATEQRLSRQQAETEALARARTAADSREEMGREMARLAERKAAAESEYDATAAKLWDEYQLTVSQAEELCVEFDSLPALRAQVADLRNQIRALGNVNVSAIEEYQEVRERYDALSAQVADVEGSRNELTRMIASLSGQMKEIFTDSFRAINENFGRIFAELFGGGEASLVLEDESDVLSCGIGIQVAPPGKVIKNLEALSGGEQALVAISIYFAILAVNPAPFCILDEIEAALDDANVSRFAQYLRRVSDKTQFIVITHRRGTMEAANVLYGVTMQEDGVSKLLKLDLEQVDATLVS